MRCSRMSCGSARRLDLAGDVEVAHAARLLRNGDRRVHPLADVEVLRLVRVRRKKPAVGDEPVGNFGTHRRARTRSRRRAGDGEQRPRRPRRPAARALRVALARGFDRVAHDAPRANTTSADAIAIAISSRSACCVPQCGITTTLNSDRAEDRADRVRRVDASHEAPRVVARVRRPRRAPAGSSRPTGTPAGNTATSDAHEVELEGDPRTRRQRRIDRPEGKRVARS